MAHFAELDDNNIVLRILVVDNSQESRGAEFLSRDLGLGGNWIQTSYSGKFRSKFAGIGFSYDPVNDVFITPQPFPSWVLNTEFNWVAPIPQPETPSMWDEETKSWIPIEPLP